MRSWNQKHLHFSGTSRQETEIKDILYSLATDIIPLEESVVDGDILTYVPYQLQHDFKLLERSEETHKEIQIALLNGANGMFRWGVCQLDAIRVCMRLGLLRKASRSLPKTLDETYARIMTKVPKEHVEDAGRILSYLIRAFGPVTIEEDAETTGADVSAARHGIDAAILYGPILQGNIDLMITLLDAGSDPNGDNKPENHLILHFDGAGCNAPSCSSNVELTWNA